MFGWVALAVVMFAVLYWRTGVVLGRLGDVLETLQRIQETDTARYDEAKSLRHNAQ